MHATRQHFLIASHVIGTRLSMQNEYKRNLVHLLRELLSTQAEMGNYIIQCYQDFQ